MTSKGQIYFDYNATTPICPEAQEWMQRLQQYVFANSSSRHRAGQEAWNALEHAREQIAAFAGAHPDDVIFTSGATESNYLALLGRFEYLVQQGRASSSVRVAVSAFEHPCIQQCAKELVRRGADVHWIPARKNGLIDLDFFDVDRDWDIVSIMAVNHETGAIQPLGEVSSKLDTEKTYIHSDSAQWAGKFPGGLQEWNISAMSLSAHKMYGPKGVGALVSKKKFPLVPLFAGSQEGGMRAGTVPVPAVGGMGMSAKIAQDNYPEEHKRLIELREILWNGLTQLLPAVERTVDPQQVVPNTLHVRIPGYKSERFVDFLDRLGICCSAGPACASGASQGSPVLLAMGYSEQQASEGVRFSLGRYTTPDEIQDALTRMKKSICTFLSSVA